MDSRDRQLLNLIQKTFPLVPRPFKEIGEKLGMDEGEVLLRLGRLKKKGILRRLGGIFDSRRLGYFSTLCALAVPPEKLARVASLVNSYPGVTHSYLREHHYNLWFTLIIPRPEEAERIKKDLQAQTGLKVLDLPVVESFKVEVSFNLEEGEICLAPWRKE